MRQASKPSWFRDWTLPVFWSVVLHSVIVSLVLLRVSDPHAAVAAATRVEPIDAVVIDERQITEELEQLRRHEQQERKVERERVEALKEKADAANRRRVEEERRLHELKVSQRERLREDHPTARG